MKEISLPIGIQQRNVGRMVILSGEVNEDSAMEVVKTMLQLQNESPTKDITLLLDSYGGDVYGMNMILDAMDIISCDVRTIVLGKAMSAGAVIFSNGTKGKRFMTKRSFLMIHQVSGAVFDEVENIKIELEQMNKLLDQSIDTLALNSKISKEEVQNLINRNCYLTAEEAMQYGFCDGVLEFLK